MEDHQTRVEEDILIRLKSETAALHQQTEDRIPLMKPDFSPEDYRRLLITFYEFYLPFEDILHDALSRFQIKLPYTPRSNVSGLQKDLTALGMSRQEISRIHPVSNLPILDSPEKVFGALYVVEGSALGGQIIARHLKEKFHLEENSGSAFFSGYGSQTGQTWNAFRSAITEFAADSRLPEKIIEGAFETFELIGRSISRSLMTGDK